MASNTLASRRLVLTLYRSLISAAAKYDKNIPSNRNPLFLIQREKDVHRLPEGNLSVRTLIREPFKNSIDTADEAKITLLIQEAFKNLRMLNQFYNPSLAWVQIFDKNSTSKDNINFANALKAISLFDLNATPSTLLDNSTSPSNSNSPTIITPVPKSAEEVSSSLSAQIDQIVARVHATIEAQKSTAVSEGEVNETEAPKETETNPEMDQATNILKAISKVLYYEMGFTFSAARQPAKEQHLLTGLFASRNGSPTLLASLYVAIAQQMGLELYTAMCNNRTLLRLSKVGEHHLFHAEDVFVDATTGKVLVGLKLAATYARNANIVSSVSSTYLPMEHQSNVNLITKMLSALAGFHSQWKEHLTICHELARAIEVPKSKSSTSTTSSEPTTSKTSYSTKSTKFEYTIRDSATPKTPPTPSSSSSSPSSSSSSTTSPSSSSSSSSTTASSSAETSTSSSSSPSTTPTATAESTSSPSSSSTTSKYGRYFNSLLSLLRPNKPTTHSPTAVSSTPSSPSTIKSNTDDNKNQKDANEKAEKGEKSEKSGEGQGKKKYSRMWSSSTDLYRNPKTRKF